MNLSFGQCRGPSPSPPSSPILEPDSSPPGSPISGDYWSNNHGTPNAGVLRNGGSFNQTRPHPQYELKGDYPTPTRPVHNVPAYGMTSLLCRDSRVQPPRNDAFVQEEIAAGRARDLGVEDASPQALHRLRPKRTYTQGPRDDESRWNQVVQDAIERRGNTSDTRTIIDLSGEILMSGNILTSISPCIAELGKLVVLPSPRLGTDVDVFGSPTSRPLGRNHTSPPTSYLGNRLSSFTRAGSQPALKLSPDIDTNMPPVPNHEIHLFLYCNQILALPDQLFELMNLTVLSLRNNSISIVPPGISFLVNLRDLNLAINKIEYLPAEMLQMTRLTTLTTAGNPFRPQPQLPSKTADQSSPAAHPSAPAVGYKKIVSPSCPCTDGPPKLVEVCLRRLLEPHKHSTEVVPLRKRKGLFDRRREVRTNLSKLYALIQPDEARLSPLPLAALRACAPDAVAKASGEASPGPAPSRRGSPLFYGVCPSSAHHTRRAFFEHAEERLSWESHVGQAAVGTQGLPMLWRGCTRGCLDFLEDVPVPTLTPVSGTRGTVSARPPPGPVGPRGLAFDEDF